MENEIEKVNSTNNEKVDVAETNVAEETSDTVETVDTLKQKNQELYEQLKKAKGFTRGEDGKWVKKEQQIEKPQVVNQPKNSSLSTRDLYALMESKVNQEDIEEVENYASFKKISITDALKDPAVKSILSVRDENRRVASATNVGTIKRASNKLTDDVLLSKAEKGEMPESMDEIVRISKARKGIK